MTASRECDITGFDSVTNSTALRIRQHHEFDRITNSTASRIRPHHEFDSITNSIAPQIRQHHKFDSTTNSTAPRIRQHHKNLTTASSIFNTFHKFSRPNHKVWWTESNTFNDKPKETLFSMCHSPSGHVDGSDIGGCWIVRQGCF
ncbi:hypothetical protein E4U54_004437 [Claviceps lovelessii]|nr:hypothetical protein E4U54_004437 [Claviceps lovelessii]